MKHSDANDAFNLIVMCLVITVGPSALAAVRM